MERNAFEFDGGMVRLTVTGMVLAGLFRMMLWIAACALVLVVTLLLAFEIAAAFVGFHPAWRL